MARINFVRYMNPDSGQWMPYVVDTAADTMTPYTGDPSKIQWGTEESQMYGSMDEAASAPVPAPEQSLAERMAAFTPSQWASDRGLGEMERLINFQQALPPEFLQQLMQGSSAPSGDPRDMWNDYVQRAQYNPSPTLAETLTQPQNLFFAGTTGLGGMTLANAATGGDVGAGVQQDALTLASTAAGQYLAGQGAFAPEVANSGMDFGGQGVGWDANTMGGWNEIQPPVAQSLPTPPPQPAEVVSLPPLPAQQPTTLQEVLQQMQQAQAPASVPDAAPTLQETLQAYTQTQPTLPPIQLAQAPSATMTDVSAPTIGTTPSVAPQMPAAEPMLPFDVADAGLTQTMPGYYENLGNLETFGPVGSTAPSGVPPGASIAAPVTAATMGPATTAATTAAAAGAAGVGATKLGDIASGDVGLGDLASNATLGDVGRIAGTGIATVGSVLAQQDIAARNEALAREYMGFGAPSRSRYEASFAPGFDITTADPAVKAAMDTSYQSLLRGLSARDGNPFGNPGGLAEAMKYVTGNIALPATNQYRNQNAATGGFNAFSTAAPGAANNAINATGSMYSDIGTGLSELLNPRQQPRKISLNLAGLT